jgi:hypothetical protein
VKARPAVTRAPIASTYVPVRVRLLEAARDRRQVRLRLLGRGAAAQTPGDVKEACAPVDHPLRVVAKGANGTQNWYCSCGNSKPAGMTPTTVYGVPFAAMVCPTIPRSPP